MHSSSRLLRIAALLALSAPAAHAQQAVYHCSNAQGKVVMSDKPCADPASSKVVYAAEPGRVQVKNEPDFWAFLNAECRTLVEAATRSVGGRYYVGSQRDARKEYSQRCQDNEKEAWERAREQKQAERQQRTDHKNAVQAKVQQSAALKQQCDEMLRILATKRRRTDLTPGERDDLQRFESSYRERCM